jgi:hypothetical protein
VGAVEPYSIMVSEKARLLRKRFTPQEIAAHEARVRAELPRVAAHSSAHDSRALWTQLRRLLDGS